MEKKKDKKFGKHSLHKKPSDAKYGKNVFGKGDNQDKEYKGGLTRVSQVRDPKRV